MTSVFDAYARYYDLLYRDKDYAAEAEYVAALIRGHSPQARRILELGCGTGSHAELLARLGFVVHGIDFSEHMVEQAQARKQRLAPEIADRLSFAQGDVRSTRTGEIYDAVISLFHVVSYQTTNADQDATFVTAGAHLNAGGLFLFDFWYGPAVLTQKPEVRVKRLDDEHIEVTRIAEPVMRPNENVVDVCYTVFVKEKQTGNVQQVREKHSMRYLFLPELERCARDRFDIASANAWMTQRPLGADDWAGCVGMVKLGTAQR